MSVIDARWLFAAKRGFTAHMAKHGLPPRCKHGTVVQWPRQMRDRSFVASLPDFTDWPTADEITWFKQMVQEGKQELLLDEDWSWLDALNDKEPT